jgi:hypothetical protein
MILGCIWTLAAVVLIVQAGPARGRSVQALLAVACLVGTTGCAMLAFAFFPRFVQRLRVPGWLTVVAVSLLAMAVMWSAWELPPVDLQLFANPGDAHDSSNLYFLRYPRGLEEQWTGIVAFALLGALGVIGLFTSYRTTVALWVHRAIAALLAGLLTLHWPPILYAELGALLVLCVTALVNLKLATVIVQHVLGSE